MKLRMWLEIHGANPHSPSPFSADRKESGQGAAQASTKTSAKPFRRNKDQLIYSFESKVETVPNLSARPTETVMRTSKTVTVGSCCNYVYIMVKANIVLFSGFLDRGENKR